MNQKELLTKQINDSPEPLRSYIHDMESRGRDSAHLIQDLFSAREQVKQLEHLLNKLRETKTKGVDDGKAGGQSSYFAG